jgi:hypothetical protein
MKKIYNHNTDLSPYFGHKKAQSFSFSVLCSLVGFCSHGSSNPFSIGKYPFFIYKIELKISLEKSKKAIDLHGLSVKNQLSINELNKQLPLRLRKAQHRLRHRRNIVYATGVTSLSEAHFI